MPEEKNEIKMKYARTYDWIKNMPFVLWEKCRLIHIKKGDIIFRVDEKIISVYIVCSGIVIISNNHLNGNEMCVVFVQEGSTIGEMEALLKNRNTVYSAKAFTDCTLLEIPLESFRKWISLDIVACERMAYVLAEKLYQSSISVVQYNNFDTIARLKLLLAKQQAGYVRKTRAELAEACGVSERTISRCVNQLKNAEIISVIKGKIFISNDQINLIQQSILDQI